MKFTHLPEDGGLYDQHPALMDAWQVIMQAEAHKAKRDSEANRQRSKAPTKGGGSRRSRKR